MRKVRENILVTKGNLAIFPGGREVFSAPHPIYGGTTVVPADGQLVVFDNRSGVSLDNVTVLGRPFISVGVAVDQNGDGAADAIKKAFGDKIWGDYVSAFTAEPARCNINEVVDLLVSCTHCDEAKTVTITVEDNETQVQFPYNRPESHTFTTYEPCCGCDGCPDTSDASCQFIQDLVKQINGVVTTDPTKVPTFSRRPGKPLPVTATRLYGLNADLENASITYCFTPIEDDCGSCVAVDLIESFTFNIDDAEEDTTVTFTGNVNPNDATQTLIAQLANIVAQINVALDGRGSAILTRGVGPCCPINLEINTCATGVVLNGEGAVPIVPCGTTNPLAAITDPVACLNCTGDPAPTRTFEFGIRVIADDVTVPRDRQRAINQIKGVLWRKVNIYPSDGFACGATYVRKTQKAQSPEGLGYQWAWREYASQPGGSGWEHEGVNKNYGPLRLPGDESRAQAGFVNVNETYCPYIIEHGLPHTNTGVSDAFRVARGRTVILVPQADTVTQASVESVLGAYIMSANNVVSHPALCGSDQDQVENDATVPTAVVEGYPDANGLIY